MRKWLTDESEPWPPDLIRARMIAVLERERRAAQLAIAELQERHSVETAAELEAAIERGEVCRDLEWEDLHEWQRLELHLQRVEHWREALGLEPAATRGSP